MLDYFRANYPDVVDLMPALADDYARNPVGSLVTVRCWPWVHRGDGATLALVGDAAHAIVPFFGQGANCAFEDTIEIDRCLDETGGDWAGALARYEQRRKANCDAIAQMALENFVEMRDKVNSPRVPGEDRGAARPRTSPGRALRLALRTGLVHDRSRTPRSPAGCAGRTSLSAAAGVALVTAAVRVARVVRGRR